MRSARKVSFTLNARAIVEQATKISAVKALRFVWIVAIVWYEFGIFFWSVAQCTWPDQTFVYAEQAGFEKPIRAPTHVLLIADPQVLDEHSYPERGHLLSLLTQVVVDLNMRKSWVAVRQLLLGRRQQNNDAEEAVCFLGDMMDNGRRAYTDAEYEEYYNRFKSIFSMDHSTTVYYIPGNHDIGLGSSRTFSTHSRSRYTRHFGPLNYKVSLGNHTLVMLDAPGLVEEDYRRSSAGRRFEDWTAPAGGVIDFVNKFASVGSEEPVSLFSHIPLFRPDTASCGPLRERGTIRRGVGFGYQNTLGRQTSEYILKNIRPSAIFSGDDHDYCEYTHSIPLISEGPEAKIKYVREVTVKSFSMAMGVQNPGFQLLSLADPSLLAPGSASHADALCLLPNQLAIYLSRYLPLFMLSLCVLGISTFQRLHDKKKRGAAYSVNVDPNNVSLFQSSPESIFPGPLGSARMPSSALSNGRLAPTYRAASATFPSIPYTPDFSTTPGERVATPGLLSVPPAGLGIAAGDVELGYRTNGDEDENEQSQYVERRMSDGGFYVPSLSRAPQRKGRLAWSRTFVLRGRRRRITVNIPQFLEDLVFKIISHCRRGNVYQWLIRDWGGNKGWSRAGRRESATTMFMDEVLRTAWPALLVFVLLNLYIFR